LSKVLITGTSAGIGLQTAIVVAKAGHSVIATMRNPERGAALRDAVASDRLPIAIVPMDVDSDESVASATAAIRSQFGSIDVLVNNAGIERAGAIETLAFEDFRATMETNYFGPLRTIRAWLPDMREQRRGCIINVSSVAGRIANTPLAPYAASKFALEALSEALAQEVRAFNVRVAIVEPVSPHRARGRGGSLPAGSPLWPSVPGVARQANATHGGGRQDSRDHRQRHTEAAASGRSRRRRLSRMARLAQR
jgi:NAD(P)-dependent dehydrogenase (short-subunit alcohol dehydrogenase family)